MRHALTGTLLVILVLAGASVSRAEDLFHEDFEHSPEDYTVDKDAGTTVEETGSPFNTYAVSKVQGDRFLGTQGGGDATVLFPEVDISQFPAARLSLLLGAQASGGFEGENIPGGPDRVTLEWALDGGPFETVEVFEPPADAKVSDLGGLTTGLESFAYDVPGGANMMQFRIAQDFSGDGTESLFIDDVLVVPEPVSAALLVAGGAAVSLRRRRRR